MIGNNPLALAIASLVVTAGALVLAAVCILDNARLSGQPVFVIVGTAAFAAFVIWRAVRLHRAISAEFFKRDR